MSFKEVSKHQQILLVYSSNWGIFRKISHSPLFHLFEIIRVPEFAERRHASRVVDAGSSDDSVNF